jgi:hypothetical protein
MSNNDDFLGFILFLAFGAVTLFVLVKLSDIGYEKGVKETTILCVEKPQDCKIKYDYIKLQEKQK